MPTATTTLIAASSDTRMVFSIVALLIALGIGLLMLAWWMFRVTHPDRELLAPLEVMGQRKWRRGDPVWQRRRLDEVRPHEAQPLRPARTPPTPDAAFDAGPLAGGFDDLVIAPDVAEGIVLRELPMVLDDEELDGDPTPASLELPLIAPEALHSELAELGVPAVSDDVSDADETVAIVDVEPSAGEPAEPAEVVTETADVPPTEAADSRSLAAPAAEPAEPADVDPESADGPPTGADESEVAGVPAGDEPASPHWKPPVAEPSAAPAGRRAEERPAGEQG